MALSPEQKKKLRLILSGISTPEEMKELEKLDSDKVEQLLKIYEEQDEQHQKELASLIHMLSGSTQALSLNLTLLNKNLEKYHKNTSDGFGSLNKLLSDNLGGLAGLFKSSKEAKEPSVPMFGRLIEEVSKVGFEVKNKPVPVWRWPQYVATSVRNKSFIQINPARDGIATSIGSGKGSVTTAGTRVQLSQTSVPCTRVIIANRDDNANLTNGGLLVVGDVSVVAALSTRQGAPVYPANTIALNVSDLNLVYIDSIDNAAAYHYYYENVT